MKKILVFSLILFVMDSVIVIVEAILVSLGVLAPPDWGWFFYLYAMVALVIWLIIGIFLVKAFKVSNKVYQIFTLILVIIFTALVFYNEVSTDTYRYNRYIYFSSYNNSIKYLDTSYCDHIAAGFSRQSCYDNVARAKKIKSICDNAKDPSQCRSYFSPEGYLIEGSSIESIAVRLSDPSYCDYFPANATAPITDPQRSVCYVNIAKYKNDISICGKAGGEDANQCKVYFNYPKNP